mmetsp:Transcript_13749/g.20732  ORF Transcript_13749/g.20732 Transcript_13749/m.20732 type:complete len:171 (+) Transcript_13749:123-635(+)|eukprot:CAMPEP_0201550906 /NCGR_PEP_ID=MMETSP0173_2-20130828/7190_1 /ASSEMBLY_ACC=CAM_ASM_000268 /TAXON_ID=218659 /ORGANISM="Vexillifera sp., Strain DIVA3 564/2" /LENGTH=170 /DNA_ID=CAMNT_0047961023 /DNA_START=146 /DNA_END=658 /DNA_ORIENTATION=-
MASDSDKVEKKTPTASLSSGKLHVDPDEWGPVVRLTPGIGDEKPIELKPGRYQLGRHQPFEVNSRACSRHQADLLVSSHTVAILPRGRRAMRLKRETGDMFVMSLERNYQIFDGDAVWLGETKFFITFNFVGRLARCEEELKKRNAEKEQQNADKDADEKDDADKKPDDD